MLILFCLHTMGLGMFRFVASLCRNENVAATAGSFFFLVLLLLGGFLLPRGAPPTSEPERHSQRGFVTFKRLGLNS